MLEFFFVFFQVEIWQLFVDLKKTLLKRARVTNNWSAPRVLLLLLLLPQHSLTPQIVQQLNPYETLSHNPSWTLTH
jgi:hypothetical protein